MLEHERDNGMTDSSSDIRKPSVAGLFYPSNAGELTKTIAGLFAEVDKVSVSGTPSALIVPHAGYPYSGEIAARAYKLLEGHQYDTVVILSPSHTVFFTGSSVYEGDGYQTPLGIVEIDKELSEKLTSIHPSIYLSRKGHATGSERGEHALEVQLPFLQVVLGNFKLVAIVMGDQEKETAHSLAEALAAALKGTNTLMVASSDLSHFHPEKKARSLDKTVQKAIEKFEPDILLETLESGKGEACGGGPMASVMMATKRLGKCYMQMLGYTTSGETTGEFDNVVGYMAAAVINKEVSKVASSVIGSRPAVDKKSSHLSKEDKRTLHGIAFNAIKALLAGKRYTPPDTERLRKKRGAFVTLKIDGNLRGCIGQIRAHLPLCEAVAEMAVAAAFDDPRFPPLTEAEFKRINVEISALTPLERVKDFDTIEIGRDGLMIRLDMHSGLLLPQVATENGWDTTGFLEQTCLKAGLPKNSYKDKYAEVYKFSADVF